MTPLEELQLEIVELGNLLDIRDNKWKELPCPFCGARAVVREYSAGMMHFRVNCGRNTRQLLKIKKLLLHRRFDYQVSIQEPVMFDWSLLQKAA